MVDLILMFLRENMFFVFWILFWFFIFIFAYFDIKINSFNMILGLFVGYILLFPISSRILIFLTVDAANLRSIKFAFLLLFVFVLLCIYTILKHFTKIIKENRMIINFVFLLNEGYKVIFNFLIKFEFIETWFFISVIDFLCEKVQTKKNKFYLYLIFNAIPKSIFFSSLFYDINMLQKLHYSLYFFIFSHNI